MAPKQPSSGIFVGLNKGHVVTKKKLAPKPSIRKGKTSKQGTFVRNLIREVSGFSPYEKRITELLKAGKDKKALKVAKRKLGTHKRAKNKCDEMSNLLQKMRAGGSQGHNMDAGNDDEEDEEDNYYEDRAEVDLRDRGYFNNVTDQGPGESCYAHAACAIVEKLHHKKQNGKKRVTVSPQDLFNNLVFGQNAVVEDGKYKHGKNIVETLDWILWNGCVLEEACPYTGLAVPPKSLAERRNEVKLRIETVKPVEREDLEEHIRTIGPVIAAIDWIKEMERLGAEDKIYTGPVDASAFDGSEGHSIVVMGFGPDYWLVRNSHGVGWGNGGYAKFTRDMVHDRYIIDGGWAPIGIAYKDPNGEDYDPI